MMNDSSTHNGQTRRAFHSMSSLNVFVIGVVFSVAVTDAFVIHSRYHQRMSPSTSSIRISHFHQSLVRLHEQRETDFSIQSLKTRFFPKHDKQQEEEAPTKEQHLSVKSLRKMLIPPPLKDDDTATIATTQPDKFSVKSLRKLWIPSESDTTPTSKGQEQLQIPFGFNTPAPLLDNMSSQLASAAEPVQELLDEYSAGWALSYADLSPEKPDTPIGVSFLATNLAYFFAGMLLFVRGDAFFGLLTDVTALASFNYHYTQLEASGKTKDKSVRLALLLDYVFALMSIGVALFYSITSPEFPLEGLGAGLLALVCLGLCWVWEEGKPYMILSTLR